jgi:outer membrane protein
MSIHLANPCLVLIIAGRVFAQSAPVSPDHPWHSFGEQQIEEFAHRLPESEFGLDASKIYSVAELVDLAEAHNPETRVAWERARAQAAALGVARSELFPTLAAAALSQTDRSEVCRNTHNARETKRRKRSLLDEETLEAQLPE